MWIEICAAQLVRARLRTHYDGNKQSLPAYRWRIAKEQTMTEYTPNTSNQGQNPEQGNEATPQQRVNEALETAGEKVKTFVEENKINEQIEVAGGQVVERVKGLIEEGNVRRLIIRNPEGRTLLEIPLTAGVVVGGAVLWLNPVLAGLGAIAALLARVTIEIVREEPDAMVQDVKDTVRKVKNDLEK